MGVWKVAVEVAEYVYNLQFWYRLSWLEVWRSLLGGRVVSPQIHQRLL